MNHPSHALTITLAIIFSIVLASLLSFPLLTNSAGPSGEVPAADPGELWRHMTKTDSYRDWSTFPAKGKEGLFPAIERGPTPAKNPHGAYMRLFVNATALNSARRNERAPMPNGAILVMENYQRDEKTLVSITAMYKAKGYAPESGDWFWAVYNPDGKPVEAGKVASCIGCHKARENNDWRYAGSRGHGHQGHK